MVKNRLPSDVTEHEMKIMAIHLESFIELLEDVFVIPDNFKSSEKTIRRSIKRTHELIDRLKKGDRGVFKDDEDCDPL